MWYIIGAEIGVYQGENAKSILKTLNIKTLYLIDSYELNEEKEKPYKITGEAIAKKRLKKYEDKVVWIKKMSKHAVEDIDDNSLDFIYIDGNHSYEGAKIDLEKYYLKLKKQGVLAGHDIDLGGRLILISQELKDTDGVAEAVVEFVNENKLQLYINQMDWWCVKKE